ncbi:MAG: transposase [Bacteroidia bacterium]|nr:transposase [Bacteroidia bacterium]
MKTTFLPFVYLLISLTIAGCNSNANKPAAKVETAGYAPLKDRVGELSQTGDWATTQAKANALQENIKKNPTDTKSRLLLAQLYMQEARITGEHPYYYPATLKILEDILIKEPNNFEALAFKSSVQLSLHHFAEALETGTKAKNINSNNSYIFGVLCDANVELGHYEEAVQMSDIMQSLRPGLEAYSRASYLREIYGNNQGAIDAMKLAYQAGLPGSEEASWAGNTLVHLYENTGKLKEAQQMAEMILLQRPSYAFATASLGRIEMLKGNYDKAIPLFEEATKKMPEFSFYEEMANCYEAKGDLSKSKEIYKKVIVMLNEDAASGHYADMELAIAYLHTGEHENALKHASIEYNRRPTNIDVNATMAWVLYKKGDYVKAKKYLNTAMQMKTQNANLLYKAAVIESAAGDKKLGQELAAKAKKINPSLQVALLGKV